MAEHQSSSQKRGGGFSGAYLGSGGGGGDGGSSSDEVPSPFLRPAGSGSGSGTGAGAGSTSHPDAFALALGVPDIADFSSSSTDDGGLTRAVSSSSAAAATITLHALSPPGDEIPMRPQGSARTTWLRQAVAEENPYAGSRSMAPQAGDAEELAASVLRATRAAAQVDADSNAKPTASSSSDGKAGDSAAAAGAAAVVETPLDSTQVFVIGYVAFVNILNMVIIFPFLPFYTAVFYPDVPASRLGVYVGMLASAYYVGDMFGSLLWGPFADRYGRKPAVSIGLIATLIGILLFAVAPTYKFAITVRILSGFLCGNNALTRTLMSESCDDSNQGRGFSMIGLSTGLARLFAPAIGGILALPATKYPAWFKDTIYDRHPYLFPCVIGAILTGTALVMVTGWLRETLDKDAEEQKRNRAAARAAAAAAAGTVGAGNDEEEESLMRIVTHPTVLNVLLGYFIHSFVGVISHEIVPVWVINRKEDHGFEMNTSEIGLLLSLVAPFQVVFQAWLYPVLAQRMKFIALFRVCVLVYGAILFAMPFMAYLNDRSRYVVWPVFILCIAVTMCSRIGAFTCISVMVSNSCTKSYRGSVNGVAQAASSAGRMLGPTVAGAIFAWSMNNDMPFPLNFHLIFIVLTASCLFSYFMSLFFDPALDAQKPEPAAAIAAAAEARTAALVKAGALLPAGASKAAHSVGASSAGAGAKTAASGGRGVVATGAAAAGSGDDSDGDSDDGDAGVLVRRVDFGAALGASR